MHSNVLPGLSFPLGAAVYPNGVNFCIASRDCTAIELLLFDSPNAPQPYRIIPFDPKQNKTAYYWHVFVPGVSEGQVYAYRVYGPYAPERGLRFDGNKVLLDPYACSVVGWENYSREAAIHPGDNCAQALRGVVVAPSTFLWRGQEAGSYDWDDDVHPRIPLSRTVIYELHVGGFTRNPNSGVSPEKRGTFAGLVEKIPYLQELGITAVELLPIHQFDEYDAPLGHKNYWGYSTISFFAPHWGYCSRKDPLGCVNEFRDMVKALHNAGIEVILDVVFNHTAEGDHHGPTLSFRGLWNQAYYILENDQILYSNYSGCGNTVNANHFIVARMIIDCLRYWVGEMHVDGFRFDLASALSRDGFGNPLLDPPVLWAIESDPVLAGTKIIAEAWDAAGLYQVGSFIGDRFVEWNGPYRDQVRRFVKGDTYTVSNLSARVMGSPDIYPQLDREPNRSINFMTCHDGFTLNDLVSYNEKHNEANGEDNRDGANDNHSWNCGVEGPTTDPAVEALRLKQIKNLLTILFMSQGTPMLLMGDEIRRTQLGNNNAYCQDNELSWFDWDGIEKHADLLRFVRGLIHFIQSLKIFQQERILKLGYSRNTPYIIWHGVKREQPDWNPNSHSLAFTLHHPEAGEHLYIMLNAYWEPLTFELPPPIDIGERWYRIVDTALSAPEDFCTLEFALPIYQDVYHLQARSSVVLMAQKRNYR
jgi:isoamylase